MAASQQWQRAEYAPTAGWLRHWDEGEQRHYFENPITGDTAWELPEDATYNEQVEAGMADAPVLNPVTSLTGGLAPAAHPIVVGDLSMGADRMTSPAQVSFLENRMMESPTGIADLAGLASRSNSVDLDAEVPITFSEST